MIAAIILFSICVFCLFQTYIIFPAVLSLLSRNKKLPAVTASEFPFVSILLSAFNEEKVIEEKIKSVFRTSYPADKIEFIIGSDGSTDKTDVIIASFAEKGLPLVFRKFPGRTGKSGILNLLVPEAKGGILIMTDANIIFETDTIPNLVRHFSDSSVGLVGANIVNTGQNKYGIAYQETSYIRRENQIKYQEGVVWGTMMGAFGACYAIRKELFPVIPPNFLMEDFYISMHVLEKGKKCICDLEAIASEDVSTEWKEEFKRKVRISAGNYQNLGVYYRLALQPFSAAGFAFISHKVLRWLGPFFLLTAWICALLLCRNNLFFTVLFLLQTAALATPLLDFILKKMNIHNFALRLVAYFYLMNLALFLGLIKYMSGIKTSAWKSTERNRPA